MNNTNNPLSRITDEMVELKDAVVKSVKDDVIKGIPKTVVSQITGQNPTSSQQGPHSDSSGLSNLEQINSKPNTSGKKVDPITGKPPPSKRVLHELTSQLDQLEKHKLEELRKKLDEMKLKPADGQVTEDQGPGPQIKKDQKKQDDDVQRMLNASKTSGEFKGSAGGG